MNKKFSFIGKGFIYKQHAEAVSAIGGEIVDIADGSQGPEDWKEMVEKTKADCVVILAPNFLHFEMAKFSAEKNKIVLCEKPLALKSEEIRQLMNCPDIYTVYQLRYHPLAEKLKSETKPDGKYEIEMNISVHRDKEYWESWKGIENTSGGIIFNLGIHYLDLILYLFGETSEISTGLLTGRSGEGKIAGENYVCNWKINAEASKENQKRIFKINGTEYDFSSKENLHVKVYKDLLLGRGVKTKESIGSVEIIEKIYGNIQK
jgi:UDP-N-acetyl-2-amino-2-deoxyglucuronate dehydrogenase